MSLVGEMVRSFKGALQLLKLDPTGVLAFNNSTQGFWRSFSALIIIAPIYIGLSLMELPGIDGAAKDKSIMAHLMILVLQLALWLGVVGFVARKMNISDRYPLYVIVYNWANALMMVIIAIPFAAFSVGLLTDNQVVFIVVLVELAMLLYEWFITRISLQISGLIAGAMVLGDYVLSVAISRLFS